MPGSFPAFLRFQFRLFQFPPIETVRNWEQGKRSPRGPARALLKLIEKVPQVAFAVLSTAKPQH